MTPTAPLRVALTARRVAGHDDLDDRDVVALAGVAEHGGAGGVAGDDERLDALVDEVVEALEGVLADLGDRLGPVGLARGVAEVEDRLVRQLVEDGSGDGQAAEAGVEDADGCVAQADDPTCQRGSTAK